MVEKVLNIAEPSYTLYSPIWRDSLTALRLQRKSVKFGDAGREKRCGKCGDFWPADTEFFYPSMSQSDGLHCWCKDCYANWRKTANCARPKKRGH